MNKFFIYLGLSVQLGFCQSILVNAQVAPSQSYKLQELLIRNSRSNLCAGAYSERWTNCQGIFVYSNGDAYAGEFFEGFFRGNGVLIYANGDKYEGGFSDSRRNGLGIQTFADGRPPLEGMWSADKFIYSHKLKPTEQTNSVSKIEKTEDTHNSSEQAQLTGTMKNNLEAAPSSIAPNERLSMEASKIKCTELGFTPATEGHGKCVLQLSK